MHVFTYRTCTIGYPVTTVTGNFLENSTQPTLLVGKIGHALLMETYSISFAPP